MITKADAMTHAWYLGTDRVDRIFGDRDQLSVQEVLESKVDHDTRIYLVAFCSGLPEGTLRQFAVNCAKGTPSRDYGTVWKAISRKAVKECILTAEAHAQGLATDKELEAAQGEAFKFNAQRNRIGQNVTNKDVRYAAWLSARSAANVAFWTGGSEKALEWQVAELGRLCGECA
jgi:hypothetical protein